MKDALRVDMEVLFSSTLLQPVPIALLLLFSVTAHSFTLFSSPLSLPAREQIQAAPFPNASTTNSATMRSIAIITACLFAGSVSARYECYKNPGPGAYPYCVNMPDKIPADSCHRKLPTIIYMGGSGTMGTPEEIETRTTFDGMGLLLKKYRNGNMSEVTKAAAERFITFIPIANAVRTDDPSLPNKHYDSEFVDKAFGHASARYPIDLNKLYTVGYSAGCRGMFRLNERFPGRPAAAVCVAGGAEKEGSQYLVQHPYPETWTPLHKVKNIPTRIFAGSRDETAPVTPIDTYNELERLGAPDATLAILNNDHTGLQTEPFTPALLNWLLSKNHGRKCPPGGPRKEKGGKGKGKHHGKGHHVDHDVEHEA